MAKIYHEPDLTVRFKCERTAFPNKVYMDFLYDDRNLLSELQKCSSPSYKYTKKSVSYSECGEIINKPLKCHITKDGNFKLYGDTYYKYKHKEDDVRKPKDIKNDRETHDAYFKWNSAIYKDEYINSHLDEFDIDVRYSSNYNNKNSYMYYPLRIEL